jgi:hypothetical protein
VGEADLVQAEAPTLARGAAPDHGGLAARGGGEDSIWTRTGVEWLPLAAAVDEAALTAWIDPNEERR